MRINLYSRLGEVDAIVERCRALGVRDAALYLRDLPGVAATGSPDPAELRSILGRLGAGGIDVPVVITWLDRDPDLILTPERHRREIDGFCRSFEVLGEAGVPAALHYVGVGASQDPADDAAYWAGLTGVHREFVAAAERGGIKIANHAIWRCIPDALRPRAIADGVTLGTYRSYRSEGWGGPYLLTTAEDVGRLIDEVPSPNNGVCFCTGMYIPGGDMVELADVFAGKIFYSQVRDTRGRWPAAQEVFPGTGDLDFTAILGAMRRVGYDGAIGPEHLGHPRHPGEDLEAGAVAYYRGVLEAMGALDAPAPR